MWAARAFAGRFFPRRYFPAIGGASISASFVKFGTVTIAQAGASAVTVEQAGAADVTVEG